MRIRQQITLEPYRDRNETLRLLGFATYAAYTRSKLWKIVRARALTINGATCRKCGGTATQAHHAVYTREVLTGEDVRGLVPICGWCHKHASTTARTSKARRRDLLTVRPLGDTNAWIAKPCRPKTGRREYWCECGKMRKKNHPRCRGCERGR